MPESSERITSLDRFEMPENMFRHGVFVGVPPYRSNETTLNTIRMQSGILSLLFLEHPNDLFGTELRLHKSSSDHIAFAYAQDFTGSRLKVNCDLAARVDPYEIVYHRTRIARVTFQLNAESQVMEVVCRMTDSHYGFGIFLQPTYAMTLEYTVDGLRETVEVKDFSNRQYKRAELHFNSDTISSHIHPHDPTFIWNQSGKPISAFTYIPPAPLRVHTRS